MKLTFSYFLAFGVTLTLFLFAGATQAQAQESIPGYETQDDPLHPSVTTEEKTLLVEPFRVGRDTTFIPTARPAATTAKKTEPVKTSNGRPKNDEEDALSFNFLYYIIQKFKTSDIIDQ